MDRCILDLDGVLVDMVDGAAKAHGRPNPYIDNPDALGVYQMHGLMGMSQDEFWAPLNTFQFWAELEFMPDAPEILHLVESHFDPENIVIVTSPTKDPQSASAKMWWIQKHLPKYRRRFFIGSAKYFFAGTYNVLIDDYDENVNAYNEHGVAILVPRPWNKFYSRDTIPHLKKALEMLK